MKELLKKYVQNERKYSVISIVDAYLYGIILRIGMKFQLTIGLITKESGMNNGV